MARVAIVTGGTRGIGEAISIALREQGMKVAVPFGVFLGLAFLIVLFFGPTLWRWYLALLQA